MSDQLEQLRADTLVRHELDGRRDRLILEAWLAGDTWRSIADAVGLTQVAVTEAARRANGGVKPEREEKEGDTQDESLRAG